MRGVQVDHSTVQRWSFKFSPEIEKNMYERKSQVAKTAIFAGSKINLETPLISY
jgi:transposase-like protein